MASTQLRNSNRRRTVPLPATRNVRFGQSLRCYSSDVTGDDSYFLLRRESTLPPPQPQHRQHRLLDAGILQRAPMHDTIKIIADRDDVRIGDRAPFLGYVRGGTTDPTVLIVPFDAGGIHVAAR